MRWGFVQLLVVAVALAGCAGLPRLGPNAPEGPPVAVTLNPGPEVMRPMPRPGAARRPPPGARTVEAFDTTTAAERAAARAAAQAPAPAQALLGQTLAALGSPAEPGLWLRTGLVDAPRPGRVETLSGTARLVELRPSGRGADAGSEISLAALRALGQPLTALVELRVFRLP